MTARARWLILGFALLGLAFAGYSSWVHYRLLTDPGYISPCDINATFNCTEAYLSRFGTAFGVPVALGGVAWFALVALIAGFARPDRPESEAGPAGSYLFAMATVGLAAIMYLGYASWVILKTACLLCMGTYVCVVAIFIVSGLTNSVAVGRLPGRLLRDLRSVLRRPAMLTVALLYLAGAGTAVAFFPREMSAPTTPPPAPSKDLEAQFRSVWDRQPRIDLGIAAGGAKVVVVKFNDWLCPSCKAHALEYQPVLDKYAEQQPGAVKYVVKDWPWNSKCNFTLPQTIPGHEASCDAAVAVRIARDHGREREMVDWLFGHQERLVDEDRSGAVDQAIQEVRQEAAQLAGGVDFDAAYAAKLPDIRRDVADGNALHVSQTPTFFINGVRIPDGQDLSPEFFDLAIKIELERAGGRP